MILAPHAGPLVWRLAGLDRGVCCVKFTCCCPRPTALAAAATRCHGALGGMDASVRCGRSESNVVLQLRPALIPPTTSLLARSSEPVAFPANVWSPTSGFQRLESPPPRAFSLSV
jgi:hypothetical protein